jgi:AraC-like DNA-binding protein
MSILFLLASIGVINGLVVSAFLLFKKKRTVADMYFAGLLLAFSIRIGKSIYFYFNEAVNLTILQIGLSACIFIGPFFYLYMKSLFRYEESIRKNDIILLITLLLLITIVGIVYPYQQFPDIWNAHIIYGIYAVWLLFTIIGLFYTYKMLSPWKNTRWNNNQRYVLSIAAVMVFITLTYFNALFIGFTYIWGAFIFTFSFYFLAIRMFTSSKPLLPKKPTQELPDAEKLLKQVKSVMKQQKLFINKKLRLEDLAAQTEIPRHTLSQLLNETYPHGFSHFVKKYRVEEAKTLIMCRPELSLEGIGYEAGFNSKSAFFQAFKNITGYTPAAYKNEQLQTVK